MFHYESKQFGLGEQTNSESTELLNEQRFLTLKELCAYFNVRPDSIYKLVESGLTEYRFSERLARYDVNEVLALTRNRKV